VLLEYVLGEKKSYVWVVTRSSFRAYPTGGRTVDQDRGAARHQTLRRAFPSRLLPRQEDLKSAAGKLSKLILQPIEQDLRSKRIVLIVGDDNFAACSLRTVTVTWRACGQTRCAAHCGIMR